MASEQRLTSALSNVLTEAFFPELPNYQRGKVRESYDLPDGRRIMIATDRQSAFDQILAAVPYKGQVLTETARFWFQESDGICPNHVLFYPDPNVIVAKKLDMLPLEIVVRDYMTGTTETSIWTMYDAGAREVYGHRLPEEMKKNQRLPKTLITPTTKGSHDGHDRPISEEEILAEGLVSAELWQNLVEKSLALFKLGREVAERHGLILVDTKFEFGLDPDGNLVIADEILTPDSSRYWIAESYNERLSGGLEPQSLDKEFLRLWISQRCDPYHDDIPEIPKETLLEFSGKYITLFERVTGRKFDYPEIARPIKERVRDALAATFPEYFQG